MAPALRSRATALAASVGVHLAVLALGTSSWCAASRAQEPVAPPIPVTILRPTVPAELSTEQPSPEQPLTALPSPTQSSQERLSTAARALRPAPQLAGPKKRVLVEPSPELSPAPSPAREVASAAPGLAAVEQDTAPAPSLSPEQRKLYLDRYLQEIFRSRIAARFHYPEQAERLGIEGLVVLRVSVQRSGALLHTHVVGACPHRILCEAAERTVRQAAPFPPPPAELGGAIAVAVPFEYRLE